MIKDIRLEKTELYFLFCIFMEDGTQLPFTIKRKSDYKDIAIVFSTTVSYILEHIK